MNGVDVAEPSSTRIYTPVLTIGDRHHQPADPIIWLRTETCGLGPYRADLVETYWHWEQNPTLLVGYGRQAPESLEARTEGMAHHLRGENIRFTI